MRKLLSVAMVCNLGVTLCVAGRSAAAASASAPHIDHPVASPSDSVGAKAGHANTGAPSQQQNKEVAQWFNKYDEIRHEAQMTPAQKAKAHTLITAAFTQSDGDKSAAKALLSNLSSRYKTAIKQLSALKPIPQTAKLQDGYMNYFKTAARFFQMYQVELNKRSGHPNVDVMKKAREDIAVINVSNKLLDHQLRKKYNIAPYPWD